MTDRICEYCGAKKVWKHYPDIRISICENCHGNGKVMVNAES